MLKKQTVPALAMSFLVMMSSGCTHNMRITNADDYFIPPAAVPKQTVKLGVTSANSSQPQNSRYISAIVDALQRNSAVERVIYPYTAANKDQADAVIDLSVNPRYDGKGSNFFVNWPGFLIFAPAIWGYGYTADISTEATITNLKNGKSQQLSVPAHYEFRQAEIDRTWTEVGWFEVGIIPLIGGIAFTGYDDDLTPEFIKNVGPSYGPYVATKTTKAVFDSLGY
ncbi:hypothetical protein KP003_04970 [Geomonas nitrogeniifigens]|uniref:Uncharacterized protein n=1 Tax=Geomonas diazotrophica TaxID=2843197 RepID=A0ABX8JNA3_9BACT|nr:hypothetical protein [Geomonas nitrogeniifigens]QWV98576.1 hypothetical protein KP005_04610 [Geomonas nitrogeniifigens]QXE87759.1 hypothetical protein KP003_04970 [Geomonas nitrogeniifigens]